MSHAEYPKVLVAIPTYEGKDYIFNENFQAIKQIAYPNFDYVYIDNTAGINYAAKLKRRGVNVVHVTRGSNSRQALCTAQNYARKKCLDEGYDYLMFIESDLIPTPDCISRLMSHGKAIVGATYYIGHDIKVPCIFYLKYKEEQGMMGTQLIRLSEVKNFLYHGLQPVHGMGLGCTLIRRDIVQRFPYWYDERFDKKHSDVYFYMDLHNNGLPVFADSDYIIQHFPSDWSKVGDR